MNSNELRTTLQPLRTYLACVKQRPTSEEQHDFAYILKSGLQANKRVKVTRRNSARRALSL